LIQFLLSAFLTRGIENINDGTDHDSFIASDDCCTQKMINFLLTGIATSAVHDGTLDQGIKTGITERPIIGLLHQDRLEKLGHVQVTNISFLKYSTD
jgi:hypothetical protein